MFEVTKDPSADLDYQLDWTLSLGTDTITESTWSAPAASGLVAHDGAVDGAGKKTTIWLSGGNGGTSYYLVTNHITTAAGREDERSLRVTVVDR